MRVSLFLYAALAASGAHASWFGSDTPPYSSWSNDELTAWLKAHSIALPSTTSHASLLQQVKNNWDATMAASSQWTTEQYYKAQKSFNGLSQSTFDAWDESRLREFLLEQGVVAPSGPREKLVLMAKQKYYAFNNAASSLSSVGSISATSATNYVASAASTASASASSFVSVTGNSASSVASVASKSATSAAAAASTAVVRALDDSKDYVYSTWDESKLRAFLESKGHQAANNAKATNADLIKAVNEYYSKATTPAWETWSDSYMREWLIVNGVIEPSIKDAPRSTLTAYFKKYYYSLTDTVWGTWSDSQLKGWLIKNGYVKSDTQIKRDQMVKMVEENYSKASDTMWSAWSDNAIRQWLIDNGYMRTDAQVKRDELVKAINEKYTDASTRTAAYLTWPDARLRAYLRARGISESALPTSRPGLLQETRIKWVQANNKAESIYTKLAELISSGTHAVEDTLGRVLEVLSGTPDYLKEEASQAKGYAGKKGEEARQTTGDYVKGAGDHVKKGGEKLKGEL